MKDRAIRRSCTYRLPEDLYRRLKVYAAVAGEKMTDVVIEALDLYLYEQNKGGQDENA